MSFIKVIYIIIFIFTINCSGNKVSNYHGVKLLDSKYEDLKINITNKNDILKIVGPPSLVSDFDKNKWIYVERLKSNQSIIKLGSQKIKKNNVLVVKLDNSGMLIEKKLYNLNDMNDLKYLKKTTDKDFDNQNILYDVFTSLREKINAPLRNKK
tara:strand:- start:188 stop:649 length:462 start_codon:yes stop_codon:yes gene_type:complete